MPKRKSNILEVQTIVLIDVKKTFWGRYLYDQVLSSPSLKTFITLPQLELAIKAHYIEPYHPRWGPFLIFLNEQNTQKRGFVSRDGAPPLVTIKCVAKMNRHHKLIVGVGAWGETFSCTCRDRWDVQLFLGGTGVGVGVGVPLMKGLAYLYFKFAGIKKIFTV